jgi:hypothetical protein
MVAIGPRCPSCINESLRVWDFPLLPACLYVSISPRVGNYHTPLKAFFQVDTRGFGHIHRYISFICVDDCSIPIKMNMIMTHNLMDAF